jgi:hypothetical protein
MIRTVFYFLLFAALLSACGPLLPASISTPQPAQPTPQSAYPGPLELGETWTIKMQHSGGIMGLSRTIEISSDGEYTITDERTDQTAAGQLTTGEMSQLRNLVTTAKIAEVVQPDQTACADCFVYALEIDGTGNPFTVQLNDITLPESGLESMVMFLRDLMDRSLT